MRLHQQTKPHPLSIAHTISPNSFFNTRPLIIHSVYSLAVLPPHCQTIYTAEGVDSAQFRVFSRNKLRALFDDDAVLRWIVGFYAVYSHDHRPSVIQNLYMFSK